LKSVILPATLQTIGESAFYRSGLIEIDIPGSVTDIGQSAFGYCQALKTAKLSAELQAIPNYMFSNCTSLTEITLPATLETIGTCAFQLSGLKTIALPASVEYIDEQAFACSFDNVIFEGELPAKKGSSGETGMGNIVLNYTAFSTYGVQDDPGLSRVFLPAVNTQEVAATYDANIRTDQRPAARIYYGYTGSGDRTDPANYTAYPVQ